MGAEPRGHFSDVYWDMIGVVFYLVGWFLFNVMWCCVVWLC